MKAAESYEAEFQRIDREMVMVSRLSITALVVLILALGVYLCVY